MLKSIHIKGCLLLLVICWPIDTVGQQIHFIDSLYLHDFSELQEKENQLIQSQIQKLRHDYGLTGGIAISNFNSEDGSSGLSTRLYGKIRLWEGGIKDNQLQAEILRKKIILDSINHQDSNIDFNYGLYYDYIIYLFNQKKETQIDSIINNSNTHLNYLYELYYNKLIDFEKLIAAKEIISNFKILKESQQSYNQIFRAILKDKKLPKLQSNNFWLLDFQQLNNAFLADTSFKDAIYLEHNLIDDAFEKNNLAELSIILGYDFSRHRSYYAFSCAKRIWHTSSKERDADKQFILERYRTENIQKCKELVNIKYEYDYKIKQLNNLNFKRKKVAERLRILEAKRSILSLSESMEEKKLLIDDLLIQYEITELKQQSYLWLLKIKHIKPNFQITDFLKTGIDHSQSKKYMADRYIFIRNKKTLSNVDQLFIKQNELIVVDAFTLMEMQNIIEIDPSKYDNRAQMENRIKMVIERDISSVILINNLKDLKILELNSIKNKSLTNISYK